MRAHDASGSCISANSLAWHLSRPDEQLEEAIREKDRRLDEQQQAFAEVLVDAGVAVSVAAALGDSTPVNGLIFHQRGSYILAAHVLGVFDAAYETADEFVESLLLSGEAYLEFCERPASSNANPLPRYAIRHEGAVYTRRGATDEDMDEDRGANFARLGWSKDEFERGGPLPSPAVPVPVPHALAHPSSHVCAQVASSSCRALNDTATTPTRRRTSTRPETPTAAGMTSSRRTRRWARRRSRRASSRGARRVTKAMTRWV